MCRYLFATAAVCVLNVILVHERSWEGPGRSWEVLGGPGRSRVLGGLGCREGILTQVSDAFSVSRGGPGRSWEVLGGPLVDVLLPKVDDGSDRGPGVAGPARVPSDNLSSRIPGDLFELIIFSGDLISTRLSPDFRARRRPRKSGGARASVARLSGPLAGFSFASPESGGSPGAANSGDLYRSAKSGGARASVARFSGHPASPEIWWESGRNEVARKKQILLGRRQKISGCRIVKSCCASLERQARPTGGTQFYHNNETLLVL